MKKLENIIKKMKNIMNIVREKIMSKADKYFKEEIKNILETGFSDKNFEVRPVLVNEGSSTEPAHTI